jgi:pilus assembly protein Flp/PilA
MLMGEVKTSMFDKIMVYALSAYASIREREEGQALVEYALIVALVSIAAIAALTALGGGVRDQLQSVADTITAA